MKYGYDDYNDYHVLKVPKLLLLLNLYLLKPLVFFLMPMISSLAYLRFLKQEYFHITFLITSLAAMLVLISMMRRGPDKGHFLLAAIWKFGRQLLILNLAVEFILIGFFLWAGEWQLDGVKLMFLYVDLAFIVYLLRSKRIKDVFSEYFFQKQKAAA